jgi:hypothetical protein
MILNHAREDKKISLSMLCAIAFILYTLRGSTSSYAMYISLGLLTLWIIVAFLSNDKIFLNAVKTPKAWALLAYLFFYFFTGIYVAGIEYTVKLVGTTMIIFSPMIMFSYYRKLHPQKLKLILLVSLMYSFYLLFKSLSFYSENTNAARKLASNSDIYGDVAIGGGYALAYASTILAVYLLDLLLNGAIKRLWIKIVILLSIIFISYLVVSTKSTLTILWLIIGFGMSLIMRNSGYIKTNQSASSINEKKFRFWNIIKFYIFFFIIMLFLSFHKEIGSWIIQNTVNNTDVISARFREIGYSLVYGLGSSDYLSMRMEIPLKSISSFLQNPIVGRGYEYGYVASDRYSFIGGHGEWVDVLGNMGIMGAIPFFMIILFALRDERKMSKGFIPANYLWIIFLLGIFNPLSAFQPMFIFMFVIPSLSFFIFNKNIIANKEDSLC